MASTPRSSNQIDIFEQRAYATLQGGENGDEDAAVDELRRRNSQILLLQLPDKILLAIVEHHTHIFRWLAWDSTTNIRRLMEKYKILAMSQVCHRLRTLLTSSPSPWRVITSLPHTNTSFVLELLHRAIPHPVDFIAVTNAPYGPLLPQLQAAIPFMHSLVIELCEGFYDVKPDDFQPLSGVAPYLRSLKLTQPVVSETGRLSIPNIVDGVNCPELVSLEVVNIAFSPAQFTWSGQLTHLILLVDPDPGAEFTSPLVMDVHVLLMNVLSHLPLLKDLELDGVFPPSKNNYQLLTGIKVDLCHLRQLRVANHGRSPSLLLKHVNIPVGARVEVDFKSVMHESSVRELIEILSQKLSAGATLDGFVVRPVTGGGQDAFIAGYTEVDSVSEFCSESGDLPFQFKIFIPSALRQQPWPSMVFGTLARLPLHNVKMFHMDKWASTYSTSDMVTLLQAMPLIHTLCWSGRTFEQLVSLLMADFKEVEGAEGVTLPNESPILSSLKTLIIRTADLGDDSNAVQASQSLCLALKARQEQQMPVHSLLLYDCTQVSQENLRLLAPYVNECFHDDALISV
ncbi:unnamed protein product [Somion occarium]|uniref:F-box domain-containing protein n=1 Tax=Somion occarium TaxID=3059160 RepID=A0ABP1E6K9_9APHY